MPPPPVRVSSQRLLAPSVASVTSVVKVKGDTEMIMATVHRYPGICLTAEEIHRKRQLGNCLMKGMSDQSSPQMGPFPPNEVGRTAQLSNEKAANLL